MGKLFIMTLCLVLATACAHAQKIYKTRGMTTYVKDFETGKDIVRDQNDAEEMEVRILPDAVWLDLPSGPMGMPIRKVTKNADGTVRYTLYTQGGLVFLTTDEKRKRLFLTYAEGPGLKEMYPIVSITRGGK